MKDSEITELLEGYRKKDKLTDLEKQNRALVKELADTNKRLDAIIDLDRDVKPVSIKSNIKLSGEATAVIMGSDWHIEEYVDPLTINGKNSYTLNTAWNSACNFFANGCKLIQICRKDIKINNLVLAFLGDLISGYIHDELIEDNQLSPTQASIEAFNLIVSGIQYLLDKSGCNNIIVVCKYGNHGRTTQKYKVSTAYKNSYEWMVYNFLQKHFEGEKRLTFIIEKSYHTYVPIYGFPIRFHHGDYVKYQGGIGGLTIPLNKAIAQWNKARPAYLDVLGHWHQLQLDTGSYAYCCNGSLIGFNAFAISIKASYELPQQGFFLIDKKRGKTITAPIFVR